MERYLRVPEELPEVVGETALEIVGSLESNYEKAVALQAYFTGGQFEYSEEAPVAQGYDGSGAQILGEFLFTKSGYCVHFSSAMAAMARTLGIPSRVVVGFTPGSAVTDESGLVIEYRITTDDLHAWPELYFAGIGWVQFEPTPGRGIPPDFSVPPVDDPSTPDVDESIPTARPTTTPTATPTGIPVDETTAPTPEQAAGSTSGLPWWLGVVAGIIVLLLAPWAARAFQRYSRFVSLTKGGSVVAAWDEVRATARDLGIESPDTLTPRVLADQLAKLLVGDDVQALRRIGHAIESESFAAVPARVEVSDVRTVLAGLRRAVAPRERILATLFPISLFGSWLPIPARAD
jgi:transglutaminase-like putative cysteine protease